MVLEKDRIRIQPFPKGVPFDISIDSLKSIYWIGTN